MTNDKDGACPCWGTDKEVEQLHAELEAVQRAHGEDHRFAQQLKAENAQLAAALGHWRAYFQASIPRNAAEMEASGEDFTRAWFEMERALKGNSTTLRDLLAPTEDALGKVFVACGTSPVNASAEWYETMLLKLSDDVVKPELDRITRLREVCEKGTDAKRIH